MHNSCVRSKKPKDIILIYTYHALCFVSIVDRNDLVAIKPIAGPFGHYHYNGIIPVDDLHCYEKAFEILEKKLNEKYTVEQIVDTLREMNMHRPGEKLGYNPAYTRTDLTDDLHAVCGFRTDYEIITDMNMKKVIRESKKK